MARWMLTVVVLLVCSACAANKKDNTVCPEYRSMRCMAGVRCSMDQERGCRVCQCDSLDGMDPKTPVDDNTRPPE
ncbi:hypothetical protein [Haliangium sp.]